MSQTIIITNAGRAALINAANTGTNPATITQMGITATAFTPTPEATSLPGEIKRVTTMSGVAVADDAIHLTVRDDSTGAYAMRGYAFYLNDGTLFAIYGQTAAIVNKTAASMMLLSLDVAFADITTENIEFGDANFILPIATTTVYGQVKLSTLALAQTGTDNSTVLTPSTGRQSVLPWLLAQDGAGSGLDADLLDGQQASAFLLASLFTGPQILSRVLTSDGAGSGLDADMLDGQHGSDFLQAALFTGAQIMSRLTAVDGAGSGLDADLLDGQQGSWYADVAARLGFTPANKAGDTFSGPIGRDARFYLDMLASNPVLQFDTNDYLRYDRANNDLGLVIAGALNRIMHMGNDGAGSGFDADLLDGQHSSAFLQASMFTAAQILTHLLTVDGAGSGLDADLLGGQSATYYQAVEVGSLAFFPIQPHSVHLFAV